MVQLTKLPVFAYPTSIKFTYNKNKRGKDRKATLKQLIQIFNPLDISVKFKITTTAPRKYKLSTSEGYIDPECSFDVIVEHCMPSSSNCGIVDKFCISVTDSRSHKVSGTSFVDSILLEEEEETIKENEDFPINERLNDVPSIKQPPKKKNRTVKTCITLAAFLCVIFLGMGPEAEDLNVDLPQFLYYFISHKVLTTFVLAFIFFYNVFF